MRTSDKSKQCSTINCFNVRAKRRKKCDTCLTRISRNKYPDLHLLNNLRTSAKKRGLVCDITLKDWRAWLASTGFMNMPHGRKKGSRSIGRIDHSKGYSISNIRVEEYMFNSRKQASNEPPDDNCPF